MPSTCREKEMKKNTGDTIAAMKLKDAYLEGKLQPT